MITERGKFKMGVYPISEVIRRTREGKGMTRGQLCEGICDDRTLRRVETGEQTPNRVNFTALMERLGKDSNSYSPFVYCSDLEVYLKWETLENLITKNEYEEAESELLEFEKELNLENPVNQQFVKRLHALIDYRLGRIDSKTRREQLIEALRCTIPMYQDGKVPRGIFSRYEIRLFCNIAMTYAEEEEYEKALVLLKQLEQYFKEIQVDQEERAVSETLVLSNLAQTLGRMGNITEALEIGERAQILCEQAGRIGMLPNIIYNNAYGKEMIGESKEACQDLFRQAYYLGKLCGNRKIMEHIAAHFMQSYGEEIIH